MSPEQEMLLNQIAEAYADVARYFREQLLPLLHGGSSTCAVRQFAATA